MQNNDYMYAIERNEDYLAHYGVRGMKWGVRKAIASGNSKALSRHYAKAQKKLAKLEKRAANSGKYARRAALMGAGAAVAGGAAALGTSGVGNVMRKYSGVAGSVQGGVGKAMRSVGSVAARTKLPGVSNAGRYMMGAGRRIERGAAGASKAAYLAGRGVTRWGQKYTIGNAIGDSLIRQGAKGTAAAVKSTYGAGKFGQVMLKGGKRAPAKVLGDYASQGSYKMGIAATKAGKAAKGINNNTIARVGAGVIGAGLAAGAARNAYKAATAQKKANKFRAAMNESFKGTKYANGGNRQGKKRRR